MRKEHEDKVDPSRPALVVLYGATRKKVRPLEGELTVLGRAPGCDIGLVSPEVAPVHCLIVRLGSGWRIRDCSGRSTRVNGKAITDEPLRNGDVLQVGTFSFEAHLPNVPAPAPRGGPAGDEALVERLRQSRRRLGELALNLRRQLREQGAEVDELARREADLAQIERRARAAHQEAQARKAELDDARRQLDRREAELAAYSAALRRQAREQRPQERAVDDQGEAGLARQRRELSRERADLEGQRDELRRRQAEVEAMVRELQEALTSERAELDRERSLAAAERAALDELRRELHRQREALERQQGDTAVTVHTPGPRSSRETHHDTPDGLAAARQLLRELSERRKSAETKHDEVAPSTSDQVPAAE